MLIKQIIKGPEGDYEFSANVSEEEFNFIFSAGINYLLQEGAIADAVGYEDDEEDDDDPQYKMDLN